MGIDEFGAAISDKTRLRLIEMIHEEGPLTSKQAHSEFIARYDDRRRESIYKALEKLVAVDILTKTYRGTASSMNYNTML
mgnify:CR=1 FL=1